jgi:hypothetical protein
MLTCSSSYWNKLKYFEYLFKLKYVFMLMSNNILIKYIFIYMYTYKFRWEEALFYYYEE